MNRNLLEQIYIKIVTEITNIESFLSHNLETNRLRFFNVDREISAFPSRLFRNPISSAVPPRYPSPLTNRRSILFQYRVHHTSDPRNEKKIVGKTRFWKYKKKNYLEAVHARIPSNPLHAHGIDASVARFADGPVISHWSRRAAFAVDTGYPRWTGTSIGPVAPVQTVRSHYTGWARFTLRPNV